MIQNTNLLKNPLGFATDNHAKGSYALNPLGQNAYLKDLESARNNGRSATGGAVRANDEPRAV